MWQGICILFYDIDNNKNISVILGELNHNLIITKVFMNLCPFNLDILFGIGYSNFLLSSQIKNWTNMSNYYVKLCTKFIFMDDLVDCKFKFSKTCKTEKVKV